MSRFNEFHHAFITGYFYDELKQKYGDTGIAAFSRAVKIYGEQRGNRMAMRAIRDGNDLSYDSYFQYVEWKNTPEYAEIKRSTIDGVMLSENFKCPWNTALREMGLTECGLVYCGIIDKTLVRGFNPELKFELESVLYDSGSCRLDFYVGENRRQPQKSGHPIVLALEYHCAHIYWTYIHTIRSIFGEDGESVIRRVKERFAGQYSEDMVDTLEEYASCDFTYLPTPEKFKKYI